MSAKENLSTVLITGGTDGLGRACAVLLAEQGYRVFAAGRSAEKRAQLEALARERQLPLESLEMDVCDERSVDRALDEVLSKAGPVEVLVNNAGIGYYAPVEELRLEDLRRVLETNFFAVARMTQKVLPEMRQAKRGRIVNMSSLAGKLAIPMFGAYAASKFALEAWSDALRLEVHPFGLHVALIEPGVIHTSFQSTARESSASYWADPTKSPYAKIYEGYNRRRKGANEGSKTTPEDCARVVLRAVRETPPRPRYTVTPMAWWFSRVKRILSDRMMDRLLIRAFGLKRAAD